jgi:tripartite-type tricarboxylate transporter receptor subunit TctC
MIASAFISGPASAQSAADYYKDNTIRLIVSSGAGGGYDVYSRMLARHIVKHLPGTKIVVQNMPGASGLTAINYMSNVAPKDGSVFADTYSTMPLYPLLDGTNAKFDAMAVNWIGSISRATSVCIAWHTNAFKTLDDASAKPMKLSSTGATGWRSILPRVYNEIGGTKFEVIMGYDSGGAYLAIERGEVDGSCTTFDTLSATQIDWIKSKKITFLAQFGLQPLAALKDVPMGLDRIKKPEDREAAELILSQQETGRPYLMPPGVARDRVELVRAAFAKTMQDTEFLADCDKGNLLVDAMTGAQMDALLKKIYATPKKSVDHAKAILERAAK